jgi:hypothetical protein
MFFKIEKSGCGERKGLVEVRYDLYLDEADHNYSEHHVQVPIVPETGYPNQKDLETANATFQKMVSSLKKDKSGLPILPHNFSNLDETKSLNAEIAKQQQWIEGLPKQWQHNPFCCHFCQFEPNVTDEEILFVGELALDMAYKNWQLGNLALNRNQPIVCSAHTVKKAACQARVEIIKSTDFSAIKTEGTYRIGE